MIRPGECDGVGGAAEDAAQDAAEDAARVLAQACGEDPGPICELVLDQTGSPVLAGLANWLVATPLTILLVVVLALAARAFLRRGVRRVVARASQGSRDHARWRWLKEARDALEPESPITRERRRQRAEAVGSVLSALVTVVVVGVAGLLVLSEIGIDAAPLLASAGVVGVAVGFGAQSLVKDFLSGVFMLVEDQFGVGDVIDTGEATGAVEAVGLRITRLRDVNGVVWHVRNGEIIRIGNHSQGWSRALLDVSVAYGTDLVTAKRVVKEVADGVWQDEELGPLVLEEPEVWGVEVLAADGVVVRVVLKTVPLEQWTVARALRERLKNAFDAEGIEIPFPQRSVWVRTEGAPATALEPAAGS